MKILITGGHVTPAIAVIDELKNHDIVFVGRKYAQEGEDVVSFEYKEIANRGITFINLPAGRLSRTLTFRTILNFLRVPLGFFHALKIILQEKPDRVLSFGGYLAIPISVWAWIFHIPLFTHEQTIVPGFANRLISKIAKKTLVSFEQAQKYFPEKKVIVTGNPIRKSILKVHEIPFSIVKDKPVVFFSGGSLGSHSINLIVERNIRDLLKNYIVIHQTGDVKRYDDFKRLTKLKDTLPEKLKKQYYIQEHFHEDEFGFVYSIVDIVVGRSGANTFFELIATKLPAIFIPLPWAGYKEQEKQAKIFKNSGTGDIFYQEEPDRKLMSLIHDVVTNKDQYMRNFKKLELFYKEDAAQIIVQTILQN